MQDLKRLRVGAYISNSAAGFPSIELVEYDGGDFSLAVKKLDDGLILVDPNRPAGYGLQIVSSDPAVLKQFANALLAVARKQESGDDTDDTTDAQ